MKPNVLPGFAPMTAEEAATWGIDPRNVLSVDPEAQLRKLDGALNLIRASNAKPSRRRTGRPLGATAAFDGAAFAKSYGPEAYRAFVEARDSVTPKPAEKPEQAPELSELELAACARDGVDPAGFLAMKLGGAPAYDAFLAKKAAGDAEAKPYQLPALPALSDVELAQCARDGTSPEGFAVMKSLGAEAYNKYLRLKRGIAGAGSW